MCYYDHATHLALRLDQWDMSGANGRGEFGVKPPVLMTPSPPRRDKRASFIARLRRLFRKWRAVGAS